MQSPQYIPIDQAARAFGISARKLQHLAQTGNLPEATQIADRWLVPYEKLPAIATREEFVLDLNGAIWSQPAPNSDVEQYLSENVAAHAAVVLAKTQASAARSETRQVLRENQQLKIQVDETAQENLHSETYIEELQTYIDQLEHYQTQLLTGFDEARNQLSHRNTVHTDLTIRYQALEIERDDLLVSMDWVSRRRYQRRQYGRRQFVRSAQEPPNQIPVEANQQAAI